VKLTQDFLSKALPYATFFDGYEKISARAWGIYQTHPEVGVSFDSRTIMPHDLFVPLPGASCDGHDFIEAALQRGACGSLMCRAQLQRKEKLSALLAQNKLFIVVPDVEQALRDLAVAWRAQLTCTVVGVTGSLGKTSTKEMLRTILDTAGSASYVSFKNYNNVLGVSYNILRVPSWSTVAVIEMGINDPGEMRQLVDIVRPTMALITTIAHTHTQGLGNSLASVAREKCEIFAHFKRENIGIIHGDQRILAHHTYPHKVIFFGMRAHNNIRARKVRQLCTQDGSFVTEFVLSYGEHEISVRMQGNHPSLVHNALAASSIAYCLQIPLSSIVAGLLAYRGTDGRFQIKKLKDDKGIILDDCYNASPESMRAALTALMQFTQHGHRIAVLGDMLELGQQERRWHRLIGRVIAQKYSNIDHVVLVGSRAREIGALLPSSLSCDYVNDWQEAVHAVNALLAQQSRSVVLVKASHGMQLDRLVRSLVAS
jgi:UDP-N-acetylmuramoyl-tripeptide--D-alanyl-D-alanine ligase